MAENHGQPSLWAELKAMAREAVKDIRDTVVSQGWFGQREGPGETPIPTANVQAPHLDADLTASERVEREIARLKGEHFIRWVFSSYTPGEGSTYSQEEIGGWEQLTPEQRREVVGVFVDWRGMDSFDRWQRIVREYYGPAPQSERENGLDIEF